MCIGKDMVRVNATLDYQLILFYFYKLRCELKEINNADPIYTVILFSISVYAHTNRL